jgi:hypothetical protein
MNPKPGRPSDSLTRRQFLTRTGATAAGLALAGQTSARAVGKRPIIGSGEHTYEVVHDWLTPPDSIRLGDTHGVTQDSQGRIYVAHTVHADSTSGDTILVFDEYGQFIRSWGARFQGGAHGLDLRREGSEEFLYLCDTAHRLVVKTTLDGQVVWEKGAPAGFEGYGPGQPFVPTNVAFAPNGDFYVTDGYGSDWIHQYTVRGNYLRTFGGKGTEPGKLSNPHGLWVDTRLATPALVVADRGNNRLQYLTLDGKHLKFVTNGMRRPCHFDIQGDLLLIPDLSSVVTILGKENQVVAQLGDGDPSSLRDHPRRDFIPAKFIHPHDAIFLRDGSILVAEWVPIGRLTLLRKVG